MTGVRAVRAAVVAGAVAGVVLVATASPAAAGLVPPIDLPPLGPVDLPPVTLPATPLDPLVPDVVPETAPAAPGTAPGTAPAPAPPPAPAPAPDTAPATAPAAPPATEAPVPPTTAPAADDDDASITGEGPLGSRAEPRGLLGVLVLAVGLGAVAGSGARRRASRRRQRETVWWLQVATEREHAAVEQLTTTDRLKTEFLGMIAHELRTPLTAVKGFVDTVVLHWDRLDDERRRELLQRASRKSDDLNRLVGQLLDFATIEAGRVEVDRRPLNLHDEVDAAVFGLAPVMAEHEVDVDVPADLTVTGDAEALGHVLGNLLSNAVKYSPVGTRIDVQARRDGSDVIVSVADQGRGIAPDEQARVFDRYYQVEGNGSRQGAGIGLAIARRFTEVQGGRIWVESEPGNGSTFSFTLPVAAEQPVAT